MIRSLTNGFSVIGAFFRPVASALLDLVSPFILVVMYRVSLPIVSAIERAFYGEKEIITLDEEFFDETNLNEHQSSSNLVGPGSIIKKAANE